MDEGLHTLGDVQRVDGVIVARHLSVAACANRLSGGLRSVGKAGHDVLDGVRTDDGKSVADRLGVGSRSCNNERRKNPEGCCGTDELLLHGVPFLFWGSGCLRQHESDLNSGTERLRRRTSRS